MYLSRILLDTQKRKTMLALNSPSMIHGMIEHSIKGERKRNLWRLDNLNGKLYLMVLSCIKPDFSKLIEQIGFDGGIPEIKEYDKFVKSIVENEEFRFRLVANPTISISKNDDGGRGKVLAHVTEEYQKKWLLDRSEKNGFYVDEESFHIVENQWFSFYKKQGDRSKRIKMIGVTYEGILRVTDSLLFQNLMIHGIGREKAYGMGLITVIHN